VEIAEMRRLEVDLGMLIYAFEDASWMANYYLDLETGQKKRKKGCFCQTKRVPLVDRKGGHFGHPSCTLTIEKGTS
jgi:hypothetical protein